MYRTPSNSELQRLVIELCRAAVTLRIAESRGMLSGDGESDRLADGIDKWLNVCERQITPILEHRQEPPAPRSNIVDLADSRAARDYFEQPATTETSPRKPKEEHRAELRSRLVLISSSKLKS